MKRRTKAERAALLKVAEQAFFKVMLAGYAGGKKDPDVQLESCRPNPFIKRVTGTVNFPEGQFVVIDEWTKTYISQGMTIIFFNGEPIWRMVYGDRYLKRAIPFLRRALRVAYEVREFNGGRGPYFYQNKSGTLVYRNSQEFESPRTFEHFAGKERIRHCTDGIFLKPIGEHWYHGGSLI